MKTKEIINEKLEEIILSFFNNAKSPSQISDRIKDDPKFGSSSKLAYGVRNSLAKKILAERNSLANKKFTSIHEIDSIKGVGIDTLHDILFSFGTDVQKKVNEARKLQREALAKANSVKEALLRIKEQISLVKKKIHASRRAAMQARQNAFRARRNRRTYSYWYSIFRRKIAEFQSGYRRMNALKSRISSLQKEMKEYLAKAHHYNNVAERWTSLS